VLTRPSRTLQTTQGVLRKVLKLRILKEKIEKFRKPGELSASKSGGKPAEGKWRSTGKSKSEPIGEDNHQNGKDKVKLEKEHPLGRWKKGRSGDEKVFKGNGKKPPEKKSESAPGIRGGSQKGKNG